MSNRSDPATAFYAVTKSDSTPLPAAARALYVGGTGDVVVKVTGGQAVTFKAVPTGAVLPIQPNYVMAATTATDIVALF